MIDAPRGRYIGKLVGARPKDEAEHFIKCRPAAAGLIAVIWARSLSTKGRCRIGRRIGRNGGKGRVRGELGSLEMDAAPFLKGRQPQREDAAPAL